MAGGKFVTAVNCMDGRVQEPVIGWMKETFQADYVDMITEPGADKQVIDGEQSTKDSVKHRIGISVTRHHSDTVAIVGHYDCAGNPGDKEQHVQQVEECVNVVKSWFPEINVIGLWVGQNWEVEQLTF